MIRRSRIGSTYRVQKRFDARLQIRRRCLAFNGQENGSHRPKLVLRSAVETTRGEIRQEATRCQIVPLH